VACCDGNREDIQRSQVQHPAVHYDVTIVGKLLIHVPVTKQYNVLLVGHIFVMLC